MTYHIEKNGEKPAYLQLYHILREAITGGEYPYGARLPSKRTLADDAGVSVITVEHSFDLLVEEGYIEARERSGYFVSYQAADQFPVGEDMSDLGTESETGLDAERDVATVDRYEASVEEFPFPAFARTMRRVLSEEGSRILEKSPDQGLLSLRQSIAEYLRRSRGMEVGPQQIVIGAGSEYLYGLIVQMLGRDRIYGLEDPCYEKIEKVYQANGARCEHLKLGTEGIHRSELKRSQATVLHVTPFSSYPSGVTASASRRQTYVRWAQERNVYIIEDDYASEFSPSTKAEDTLFSLEPERTVIYLNTFTKTISSSVRTGYMVLPREKSEALLEKINFYACTVPVFDQMVIAEFIRSGDFERHINRVRRKLRKNR